MAVTITVIIPAPGAFDTTTPSQAIEIYCVKCKAQTASRDIEAVTMKNGGPATRSTCTGCGTKKFSIGAHSSLSLIS